MDDLPRNVCSWCINKLIDVSSLICNSKYNFIKSEPQISEEYCAETVMCKTSSQETTKKLTAERKDISLQGTQSCRFCSSTSNLTSVEEKKDLIQLFQNIFNIEMKYGTISVDESVICNICIDKLEEISSFISLSLCNTGKLEGVIGRNVPVNIEHCSSPIDKNSPTSKMENVINEVYDQNLCEITMVREFKEERGTIDIKEAIFDSDLVASTTKTYQDGLKRLSRNVPEKRASQLVTRQNSLLPFPCSFCKKRFTNNSRFELHLRTHTGEKPFVCEFCKKSFSHQGNLRRHLRTHTGEKPFKCDFCNKSFRQKDYLKYHLRNHTGDIPFKCDYCKKIFIQEQTFRLHLRMHTEKMPFRCDLCEKCFSRKEDLEKHSDIHTYERPFKCDVCEKKFCFIKDLRRHLRSHTEVKPFMCDFCKESFNQQANLRRHLRTHME